MEIFRLGRTEFKVARIGFGGMSIQDAYNVTEKQAIATLNKALDLGVNFVDTSRIYEGSEKQIGYVMKTRRGECYLSSRCREMSYRGMKQDIERSLKELNTDYIDLYEVHDLSRTTEYERVFSNDGALRALKEAKVEGKIRFIGFSGHNWGLNRKLIKTGEFDAALIPYNFTERQAEEKVISLARKCDLGLFVMKVFGNGRLLKLSPPGENRYPTIEECLRFALSNKDIPLILTGVASPEEIEENVSIAEEYTPLTPEESKSLREFGDSLKRGYCYNCNYCMPCSEEINIPKIMQLLETSERADWYDQPFLREEYSKLSKTIDDCIDCEECEKRCPQHLPIRKRLKEADAGLREV